MAQTSAIGQRWNDFVSTISHYKHELCDIQLQEMGKWVNSFVDNKIASGDTPAAKQLDAYKFEKFVFNASQVLAISLIAFRLLGLVSMPWTIVGSCVFVATYLIMKTATDSRFEDLTELTIEGHKKLPAAFSPNSWEIRHNDKSYPLWKKDIKNADFVQASVYPKLSNDKE